MNNSINGGLRVAAIAHLPIKASHAVDVSPSPFCPQKSDRLCAITLECDRTQSPIISRARSPAYGIVDIAPTIEKMRYVLANAPYKIKRSHCK